MTLLLIKAHEFSLIRSSGSFVIVAKNGGSPTAWQKPSCERSTMGVQSKARRRDSGANLIRLRVDAVLASPASEEFRDGNPPTKSITRLETGQSCTCSLTTSAERI
jgi:hypothetical protein